MKRLVYDIIICDEDKSFTEILKAHIKQYMEQHDMSGEIKVFFKDFDTVLSHIRSRHDTIKVYFLDILLGIDTNGLILAKKIRELDYTGNMVFVTGHLEFSFKVLHYKLKALDYLFKDDNDLKSKVFECLDAVRIEQSKLASPIQPEKTLTVNCKKESHIIFQKDILYFETDTAKRYIILHLVDKCIEFRNTLNNLLNELDNSFWRCHRSYIVNPRHISKVSKRQNEMFIELNNGERCMFSKKYSRRHADRPSTHKSQPRNSGNFHTSHIKPGS